MKFIQNLFLLSVFTLTRSQNLCHTQTDRQSDKHFLNLVKSCSGYSIMCKLVKSWKSKTFKIPMLSSYIEYRRKKKNKAFVLYKSSKYVLIQNAEVFSQTCEP